MPFEPQILAKRIVRKIVADLRDRRGLRHQWDQIDDAIRDEICAEWERMAAETLDESRQNAPE
jgi:hypothetical protein